MVDHLQFAVGHALCKPFVESILCLVPGHEEKWDLAPLPANNPRHLDRPREHHDDPHVEYKQLVIEHAAESSSHLLVHTRNEIVTIKTDGQGLNRLADIVRKSCTTGYYRDNFVDIMLQIEDGQPCAAQMVLWGTHENQIIYY
jgi:hypothetical protein